MESLPAVTGVKNSVFRRIAVVGATAANFAQSVALVERAGCRIRLANFQQQRGARRVFPIPDERLHELCPDALAAKLFIDDHVFNLPFTSSFNDAGTNKTLNSAFASPPGPQETRSLRLVKDAVPIVIRAPMCGARRGLLDG